MKKLKIVLFLSAVMALSVGGFVKSHIQETASLVSLNHLNTFNMAKADGETKKCYQRLGYGCGGWTQTLFCDPGTTYMSCSNAACDNC
jgi:hypothetical protein